MSQDGNHEEGEVKRTSKLTAMIESENDGFNGLQISVYYSENNWETCEEVNLILDENSTINQLIDSAIYKFKSELFYDNIDKKQFYVMIFKKKKKIPNDEYPPCNPESKVKDYGKDSFCLIEDKESQKKETNQDIKQGKNEEAKQEINKDSNKKNNINDAPEEENRFFKSCTPKCFACTIF